MLNYTGGFASYSVNDLAKAKEFYGTVLGFEVKQTKEGLQFPITGVGNVFIYPKPNHVPATFTVLNFFVDEIEPAVDELAKAGVVFEHYDEPEMKTDEKGIQRGDRGPKAIAWFKDPAGNFLSVIQDK